jgi:surfactin synthase thioesterase subunit/glycosyltransferase involved in cell wall biosynthesis
VGQPLGVRAASQPAQFSMRILLAQNSLYYPAHGGGDKSNRLLLEALAARGHPCRVVARTPKFSDHDHAAYLGELAARSVPARCPEPGVVRFDHQGVDVRVVTNRPNLRACLTAEIAAFHPDVILTSTDDPAQILLEAALDSAPARVVYLARATLALPFGPDCAFPSPAKTETLRRAAAVVGVSRYVADYIRHWAAIDAVHVPISLLEPGPYPELGRFSNEYVTLVNPCAVKGISILLALADRLPHLRFAAVPTWGTNARDRAALLARPNLTLLDPVDRMDDLFVRTRVLLVPSLWAEARSRIIPEAMLRGIPVIASRAGGIPEAMLGQPYLLPVRLISSYRPALDEQMVPVADVPDQDLEPWLAALLRLTSDPAHYADLSRSSRAAALTYAAHLSIEPFEQLLAGRPFQAAAGPLPSESRPAKAAQPATPDRLSPERRRLLALRLKRRDQAKWFPACHSPGPRLFCFPHAGAGAAAFRTWNEALPLELCPVRLPGREARQQEPPRTTMPDLIAALKDAIAPHLSVPFAFYGHSMGAAVAFELARALRAAGAPLPACLAVSGARAPQFRAAWIPPPEPSDPEFLDELRRLQGVPQEALDNPDLLRLLLPALRADAALYRQYVYSDEPPLACPIFAYGGDSDPNVTLQHLAAWARQTTGRFRSRLFPGGHFFFTSSRAPFLAALANDLEEVLR